MSYCYISTFQLLFFLQVHHEKEKCLCSHTSVLFTQRIPFAGSGSTPHPINQHDPVEEELWNSEPLKRFTGTGFSSSLNDCIMNFHFQKKTNEPKTRNQDEKITNKVFLRCLQAQRLFQAQQQQQQQIVWTAGKDVTEILKVRSNLLNKSSIKPTPSSSPIVSFLYSMSLLWLAYCCFNVNAALWKHWFHLVKKRKRNDGRCLLQRRRLSWDIYISLGDGRKPKWAAAGGPVTSGRWPGAAEWPNVISCVLRLPLPVQPVNSFSTLTSIF